MKFPWYVPRTGPLLSILLFVCIWWAIICDFYVLIYERVLFRIISYQSIVSIKPCAHSHYKYSNLHFGCIKSHSFLFAGVVVHQQPFGNSLRDANKLQIACLAVSIRLLLFICCALHVFSTLIINSISMSSLLSTSFTIPIPRLLYCLPFVHEFWQLFVCVRCTVNMMDWKMQSHQTTRLLLVAQDTKPSSAGA